MKKLEKKYHIIIRGRNVDKNFTIECKPSEITKNLVKKIYKKFLLENQTDHPSIAALQTGDQEINLLRIEQKFNSPTKKEFSILTYIQTNKNLRTIFNTITFLRIDKIITPSNMKSKIAKECLTHKIALKRKLAQEYLDGF